MWSSSAPRQPSTPSLRPPSPSGTHLLCPAHAAAPPSPLLLPATPLPGGCDLFTIAAVQERRGVRFAPIGLTNMLNTGGALARCARRAGRRGAREGEAAGAPSDTGRGAHAAACVPQAILRAATASVAPSLSPCPCPRPPGRSCGWEEPLAPGQAARFRLTTRGRGSVLAYSSTSPNAVEASGGGVRFSYAPATGALRFDVPPGMPLTVDWTLAF